MAGAMAIALPFSLTMQPLPGIILLLGCYGAVNSLQFTAMNTVTLRDLDATGAGSGRPRCE